MNRKHGPKVSVVYYWQGLCNAIEHGNILASMLFDHIVDAPMCAPCMENYIGYLRNELKGGWYYELYQVVCGLEEALRLWRADRLTIAVTIDGTDKVADKQTDSTDNAGRKLTNNVVNELGITASDNDNTQAQDDGKQNSRQGYRKRVTRSRRHSAPYA